MSTCFRNSDYPDPYIILDEHFDAYAPFKSGESIVLIVNYDKSLLFVAEGFKYHWCFSSEGLWNGLWIDDRKDPRNICLHIITH